MAETYCEHRNDSGKVIARVWSLLNFLTPAEADEYLRYGSEKLDLETEPLVKVFGRDSVCHRRVGFFSETASGYAFAGQIAKTRGFPDKIRDLVAKTNELLSTDFDSILVNHYRDGSDNIGAHSDDERGLSHGTVAAISVGAERVLRIRRKSDKARVVDIPMPHGSLTVMEGKAQKIWTHEVPTAKRIKGGRVSYTLRKHVGDLN